MNIILILTAAFLPAILLLLYIWKKDPRPEPISWLITAVMLGIAIYYPVVLIERFIRTLFWGGRASLTLIDTTIQAFVVAALPEESFKLLVLWLLLRKNPHFDEHFDGIVYAVCVSLGFAAVENVFYLLREDEWVFVAIVRALLAVPGHYAFAILMGYYYSIYHFVDCLPKIVAACILGIPVVAHGIYDTFALSGFADPYIGGWSFFILIWFCIKMHAVARRKVLTLIEKDNRNTSSWD